MEALGVKETFRGNGLGRLIVGIDGLGGAGKTTFAQKLRDELKLVSGNLTTLLLNSMKLWG
jgi:adenylylsulfate kinase-like enzyme